MRFVLALSLFFAIACGSSDAGEGYAGRLIVNGSSTLAPLASDVGKRFEGLHPGLRIDVQTGGSTRGIADITKGLADVGMSSRALFKVEREGRSEHAIAMDGVAFVVHESNTVAELDADQLRGILKGEFKDWSQVGGRGGPITLIDRARGRSEVSLVTEHFKIDAKDVVPDAVAGENQQVLKQVGSDPAAISYLSVGAALVAITEGASIRLLALEGVEAKAATVADGSYPLARPLLLLLPDESDERARAFVTFAASPEVHDLVRDHSFVPLTR